MDSSLAALGEKAIALIQQSLGQNRTFDGHATPPEQGHAFCFSTLASWSPLSGESTDWCPLPEEQASTSYHRLQWWRQEQTKNGNPICRLGEPYWQDCLGFKVTDTQVIFFLCDSCMQVICIKKKKWGRGRGYGGCVVHVVVYIAVVVVLVQNLWIFRNYWDFVIIKKVS